MSMNYGSLSCGYIGLPHSSQTLNSRFYKILISRYLHQESYLSRKVILFPQRIPRAGFFEEICQLETDTFKKSFAEVTQVFKGLLATTSHLANTQREKLTTRRYINIVNLCLRYGCFDAILENHPTEIESLPYSLEIELLLESARTEKQLSSDLPVGIKRYMELADQYLLAKSASQREKIMLLNNLIVTYYRYHDPAGDKEQIFQYTNHLLTMLLRFEKEKPLNQLYCSIGYRGLAMANEFGRDFQEFLLREAERLAVNLQGKTHADKIVAQENLYTCMQSIAKWQQQNGNLEQAESYLFKMTRIDPNDSTAYSELGFFYLGNKNYSRAAESFKRAQELGAPGVGMNVYYYAKCLEELGQRQLAVDYLYQSAELDSQALSPWLDLLDYYRDYNFDQDRLKKIAGHIYESPKLKEQLEENEIRSIQNIIN